ncbi:MAG: type 4a pilus biogenesis protein PilO [Gallionellaceae bacterium]
MDVLEELKNINPKTPENWPWVAKLLACVLIFIAVQIGGYFLDWQDQLDSLDRVKQEEVALKAEFLVKKKKAVNLDIIRRQLTETQQSFGALLKQLPSKSEMDALLTDINQAGLGRGLHFELFRPGVEVVTGVFAEQPITIRVTGNYDDLGKFSSDISQLPRIVTLNDINVSPSGKVLSMNTTAKTYRYLDDEELSAKKGQ